MQVHRLGFVVLTILAGCSSSSSESAAAPKSSSAPAASAANTEPAAPTKVAAAPAAAPASSPAAASTATPASAPAAKPADSLGDFKVKTLEGDAISLDQWKGKVVLVVNTASQCGFTPQYAGLEALHKELEPKGFAVLGFPCNEFGGQEPGDAKEIRSFCTDHFQVTFPMFEKVNVKPGDGQAPLYAWLRASTGQSPSWNFCKYLVGKDGKVIQFWSSKTTPESPELRSAIDKALAAN
jgi:glutathione peroxidase